MAWTRRFADFLGFVNYFCKNCDLKRNIYINFAFRIAKFLVLSDLPVFLIFAMISVLMSQTTSVTLLWHTHTNIAETQ